MASQLAFDPTLALKVTLDHFYGIEIDEWPARIAETAISLLTDNATSNSKNDSAKHRNGYRFRPKRR